MPGDDTLRPFPNARPSLKPGIDDCLADNDSGSWLTGSSPLITEGSDYVEANAAFTPRFPVAAQML
jgi:hypothetical protein